MVLDQPLTIESIAPQLLLIGGVVSVLIAIVIAWIGDAQKKVGIAATVISLLTYFGALVINQLTILTGGLHVESKHVGWVSEHGAPGGVTLAFLSDELSIFWGFVVIAAAALFLVARQERFASRRAGHQVFTVLWSVSGAISVCFSGTVWTGLASLVFIIVSSSTVLSEGWSNRDDSKVLSRELFDRGVCLVFSIVGASLLSNYGEQVRFGQVPAEPVVSLGSRAGMLLLSLGLIGQLRPFPLSGYSVCATEKERRGSHLLLRSVLPSIAVLVLLIRLTPFISIYRCSELVSVIATAAALLTLVSSLSQKEFRQAMGLLLSGAFTIAAAMISGGQVFGGLDFGFGFAAVALAFIFVASGSEENAGSSFFKSLVIAGGLLSSGITLGLAGAGLGQWLSSYSPEHVWELAIRLVTYLAYAGAVWKVAFLLKPDRPERGSTWESQFIPALFVSAALAIWWLGAFVDPVVFGDSVRLFSSLFERAAVPGYGQSTVETLVDRSVLEGAQSLVSVIVGLLMFWMIRRRKASARTIESVFPKTIAFFRDGYRVDIVRKSLIGVFARIAAVSNHWLDERFWLAAYPRFSMRTVRALSRTTARNELRATEWTEKQLARAVEVWAKFFQLVQSGDIQWYLFVGLMIAVAMLVRYLRA